MKFEVPQRQQLASEDFALFVRSGPFHRFLRPANAELVSCGPLSLLHRRHSVPGTGFYGTEYACRAKNSLLGYATRFQRHSVRKNRLLGYGRDIRYRKRPPTVRPSYCTERNDRIRLLRSGFWLEDAAITNNPTHPNPTNSLNPQKLTNPIKLTKLTKTTFPHKSHPNHAKATLPHKSQKADRLTSVNPQTLY